jgi:peroxiredoxin 2/4
MKRLLLTACIVMLTITITPAQRKQVVNPSIPLIGHEAPSFTAQSTSGLLNFPSDFGDSWKILFAHPRDFTPVCSSEILELAHQQDEFLKLGARLVVVSTDNIDQHRSWKTALEEINFKGRNQVKIDFPLVADNSFAIANSYGMLDSPNTGKSIRGVFFIDPNNKIQAFYFYPIPVGRNTEEIKRTLIALQTSQKNERYAIPANWQPGEKVMVTYMTEEEEGLVGKPNSNVSKLSWFMLYKSID